MLWLFLIFIIISFTVIIYAGKCGSKLPELHPNNYIYDPKDNRKVVICCGDSITHGRIGFDWVTELANKDKNRLFINAGVNGDLAWNLFQRLEEIIKCKPDIITILIGTNDAMGSQTKKLGDDYIKIKKLPQRPSIGWYEENYDLIIERLKKDTEARIYLISLPWIGENEDESIIDIVKSHNRVIENLAQKHKLNIIPFFNEIDLLIKSPESEQSSHQSKYRINYKRTARIMRAVILHYIFGHTWNSISNKYKLITLCDFIHLNKNGGLLLKDLIEARINTNNLS